MAGVHFNEKLDVGILVLYLDLSISSLRIAATISNSHILDNVNGRKK